jgi:hypothetical protein
VRNSAKSKREQPTSPRAQKRNGIMRKKERERERVGEGERGWEKELTA